MSTEKSTTVKVEASDPKYGMMLAELYQFIEEAMEAGVAIEAPVKIAVNWRSGIKKIEVTG